MSLEQICPRRIVRVFWVLNYLGSKGHWPLRSTDLCERSEHRLISAAGLLSRFWFRNFSVFENFEIFLIFWKFWKFSKFFENFDFFLIFWKFWKFWFFENFEFFLIFWNFENFEVWSKFLIFFQVFELPAILTFRAYAMCEPVLCANPWHGPYHGAAKPERAIARDRRSGAVTRAEHMRTCQPCPEIYPWTGNTGITNSL